MRVYDREFTNFSLKGDLSGDLRQGMSVPHMRSVVLLGSQVVRSKSSRLKGILQGSRSPVFQGILTGVKITCLKDPLSLKDPLKDPPVFAITTERM